MGRLHVSSKGRDIQQSEIPLASWIVLRMLFKTANPNRYHFSGTDFNAANNKTAIYRIEGNGKYWSQSVDKEKGNYDYLMYADLDYNHPEVKEDVKNWAVWLGKELNLKGIRFDAVKHVSSILCTLPRALFNNSVLRGFP